MVRDAVSIPYLAAAKFPERQWQGVLDRPPVAVANEAGQVTLHDIADGIVSMDDQAAAYTQVLLARHREGDKTALQILIQRYYPRVERIVRTRLGAARLARATVADYVQDVFVRILESADKYEPRSDARWIDYVARLAQNEISNHARRDRALKRGGALAREVQRHAESSLDLEAAADTTAVPLKVSRLEEQERLDACVGELSEPHREVILLRRYMGFDWKTIAEEMGRPSPEACQELFRRALRELSDKMQPRQ